MIWNNGFIVRVGLLLLWEISFHTCSLFLHMRYRVSSWEGQMGLKTNIYSFVRAEMKEEGNQEQTRIYLNEISTRIV